MIHFYDPPNTLHKSILHYLANSCKVDKVQVYKKIHKKRDNEVPYIDKNIRNGFIFI